MDKMEKVESLREKTGVSYTEAKAALEANGDDLLEALCWLEQHGKTQMVGASCSTQDREPPQEEPQPEQPRDPGPFARGFQSLWEGLVSLFRWGNANQLVMTSKGGRREFGVPLTLFIILLVACFWVVVPLIIIALFFGNRFSFEGPELGRDDVNDAMGRATDFAESIKQEFQEKK